MITHEHILNNISELKNLDNGRKRKYWRNYRWYNFTKTTDIENVRNPSVIGLYNIDESPETDTTETPEINVIKSCIDTLTSKIAQSKVRPFFNTQNGTFKDIQIVKQAQAFFDLYYDEQNVNKKVSEAFRDSCIFDTGAIYINEKTKEISKALPWQIFIRPSEKTYDRITRVYYERKDYPVTLLSDEERKEVPENAEYCLLGYYYDTYNKIKAVTVNGKIVTVEDYNSGVIPFVFLHYSTPINGLTSKSVVDMLRSIQMSINSLMAKVNDASQLNPANTYFVPQDSSIKASQLNNRIGNIITYKATPNMTGSPVTVSTPAFIDGSYMALIESYKQQAYELVGISQLSAMSSKPTGLNSGVALSTMENIESDRFETQLNQVIRAYVDIAKTCLAIFPRDENILPDDSCRIDVRWGDIVDEAKKMTIQFSAADNLSKDPSEKLNQLQQLAMAGIIPSERIAQFMELPDLQSGYSLSNNAINAVMAMIADCLENDNFNVPDFIPFVLLKEEIVNTQLSLRAAMSSHIDNKKDIEKLQKLYERVEEKEANWQADQNLEAAMQATNGAIAENGLPMQTNVLQQEAQMTQIPQIEGADLDLESPEGTANNGAWNSAYTQG